MMINKRIKLCFSAALLAAVGFVGAVNLHASIEAYDDPIALVAIAEKNIHRYYYDGANRSLSKIYIAIDASTEAIRKDSSIAEAHYLRGIAVAIKGIVSKEAPLIEQGLLEYNQSLILKPSLATFFTPPLHYIVAKDLLINGKLSIENYKKAVSLLNESIRVDTKHAYSHLWLSHVQSELGHKDAALQAAKTAAKLKPDDIITQGSLAIKYFNEALKLRDEEDLDDAAQNGIKAYEKVVDLDPHDPRAYERLGILYDMVGQDDLAYKAITTAISIENSSMLQTALAGVFMSRGDISKAEKHYQEALKIELNCGACLNEYAFCLYLKGDYHGALDLLEKYIKTSESISTYTALCKYHSMLGSDKPLQARAYLQEFNKTFSGDAWEKHLLEYHLGQLSAGALIGKAQQRFDRCEAYFYIGSQYWHLGEKKIAKGWFKKSIETKSYGYIEFNGAMVRLAQLSDK